ncbi:hypothetical protein N9N67_04085 [Bacteriovoracaceae bacterium]|nr:hypothetical protein [Bacteriovoracaceae bacterium]
MHTTSNLIQLRILIIGLVVFYLPVNLLAQSGERISKEVDIAFGIVNFDLAENETSLEGDNVDTEAATVTGSIPSLSFNYKLASTTTRAFYAKFVTPISSADGNTILMGGVGLEFYIKSFSSKVNFDDGLSSIKIIPKYRFFWGVDLLLGSVAYTTDTDQSTDIFIEIAAQGGFAYNFSETWGLKTNVSFGQGIGILTSSTLVQFFVGASYFLD